MAMLLEESFSQLHQGWQVELLGTEISTQMVERATEGVFPALEVDPGLPAPLLVQYFERQGGHRRDGPLLRSKTCSRQMNLVKPRPALPTFDIVLLRNVLIYFDLYNKRQVLDRASAQIAPGGYLLLGTGEPPIGLSGDFETVHATGTVYSRRIAGGSLA